MSKKNELAALLLKASHAHHEAFKEVDGDDPEWPLWYAEYLQESLPALLGVKLTKSRIVFELIHLNDNAQGGKEHWTEGYAEELLKKYS